MQPNCPICGISESIPSPDHDHRANFTDPRPTVPPLDVERLPTADLVAELARRNKPTDSEAVARLLNGLSEAEILDFADWGAVTADQARDYLRALSSIPAREEDR